MMVSISDPIWLFANLMADSTAAICNLTHRSVDKWLGHEASASKASAYEWMDSLDS